MASQCTKFAPCHCHATGGTLNTMNDLKHCLTEYILWVSHRWTHRESAGSLYKLLISFRNDATDIFGTLKDFSDALPWDNVDNCVTMIRLLIKNDDAKTTKEICAIIGLCTQAAILTEEGIFSDKCINILLVLRKMLYENDYVTILNHIHSSRRS
ncbi:hypothetical protein SKPV-WA-207 [Skunkpox virus]|uniref:Uncharacterized protein n=1 Tax=Skunkpox virus TaxID=160796 RepID=A0A1C9KC40_9POXV|nr:hypothetical protein BIZ96_gp207 [Skunkpox virus]AOP31686.1 hypothetical protein SKPV-WA-207 [Skunkpox virus]